MAAFSMPQKGRKSVCAFSVYIVVYILVLQVVIALCSCFCLTLKRVGNQVPYSLILLIFRYL